MMMPANFSAIAETEMTYVVGGGLEAYLAPVMTAANWQTFNTNLITIIGNTYMGTFLGNTLGQLFNGAYVPGNMGKKVWEGIAVAYNGGKNPQNGFFQFENESESEFVDGVNAVLAGANGVLNGALNIAKNAAVIYTLGHGNATANHVANVVTF